MSISKEGLEKFRAIYTTEYDEELSEWDADRKARLLLNLYLAIYKSSLANINT